jgi:transposase
LADLTQGRLKANRAQLIAALQGRVTAPHRFLIEWHLTRVEALDAAVHRLEGHVGETLAPCRTAAARLTTMPGVSDTVARALIAEIGVDMTRFPHRAILSPGPACVPASTRVPANAARPASDTRRRG